MNIRKDALLEALEDLHRARLATARELAELAFVTVKQACGAEVKPQELECAGETAVSLLLATLRRSSAKKWTR